MEKFLILTLLLSIFSAMGASEFHDTPLEVEGFRETVLNFFDRTLSSDMSVFLLAMLPVFELRLSIPIGIHYFNLPPLRVFIISIIGNMIPVLFILFFLEWVTGILLKNRLTGSIMNAIFNRTRKRSKIIQEYEELGLIMFVAIPLPVTGAWTGSIAACLFGLSYWKSFFFIFCGVFCAGLIVLSLSLLGRQGLIIAVSILFLIILFNFIRQRI